MNNGIPRGHFYVVQQLNQRKADENLSLVTRGIDENSNAMARYLANYGAKNCTQMVIITQMFGRIREIWSHDMGLGPVEEQFVVVYDEDLESEVVNGEGAVVNDEEAAIVGVQMDAMLG
ncbi:hypothetical protein POM88_041799 [Heracleum sosnowskyi]|uniref:Uncharacterized protein n=1 Tax=Heracleum sosnowskyi TaxID=360622 RepID=A0AAD8HHC1_9APIA|nr:hypothetical protein POM88_041799 [Heracleum sosnowskyi]